MLNRCPHLCLTDMSSLPQRYSANGRVYRLQAEQPSDKGTTRRDFQSIAGRYRAKLNTLLVTFSQFGLKDTPFLCRTGCLCLFRQNPTLDFSPSCTPCYRVWVFRFQLRSSCAFGLLFLRSNRVHVKRQVIFRKQSSFRRKSILHDRLALIALSTLQKAEKSSQAQARWLNKRENKTF